jgi:hypothetical protein
MTKKHQTKPTKVCSLQECPVSHRITITLPICLSSEGQTRVLDYLRREYWRFLHSYTWRSSNVLRLVAKSSHEAFMVVRQYAEGLVRRLNNYAAGTI